MPETQYAWAGETGLYVGETGLIVCAQEPECCKPCTDICVTYPTTMAAIFGGVQTYTRVPPDPDYPCEEDCLNYNSNVYFLADQGPTKWYPAIVQCWKEYEGPGECDHIINYKMVYSPVTEGTSELLTIKRANGIIIAQWGRGNVWSHPEDDCSSLHELFYSGAEDAFNDCHFENVSGPTDAQCFVIGL